MLRVEPSGQACGARVTGVDLSAPLDEATVADVRSAWLEHLVLAFPDQRIDDDLGCLLPGQLPSLSLKAKAC